MKANKPRWRNARHIASWMQTLERHAMPTLSNTPLDRVDRGDVLQVLTRYGQRGLRRHDGCVNG